MKLPDPGEPFRVVIEGEHEKWTMKVMTPREHLESVNAYMREEREEGTDQKYAKMFIRALLDIYSLLDGLQDGVSTLRREALGSNRAVESSSAIKLAVSSSE